MSRPYSWLVFILTLTLAAGWIALPQTQNVLDTNGDGVPNFPQPQKLGLDLVGGLRVLLQAELPAGAFTPDNLRDTANSVSRRVNALGTGEATVQVQGTNRILVELPGVTDPTQAISTIQQTALLEFVNFNGLTSDQAQSLIGQRIVTTQQLILWEQRLQAQQASITPAPDFTATPTLLATPDALPTADLLATLDVTAAPTAAPTPFNTPLPPVPPGLVNPLTGRPFDTVMTGAGLRAAAAQLDQQGAGWIIAFQLTDDGSKTFSDYTAANVGQAMAIVLDGVVLSAPRINSQISGQGIIQGAFTEDEARTLALQLRSGALPIPLRVESAETVGATLGQESITLSVRAGIIGILVVFTFMVVYYRVPGVAAALALAVFVVLNLALFKVIPLTLTLPSIIGFLISIGTAVDGNILIFERMKEELRSGKTLDAALESGFNRAWATIRDSNLSTILISSILFLFGQTPGASIVSGFAVTLIIGLLVNLFTAVLVTRTFLHVLVHFTRPLLVSNKWLVGA